MLSGAMGGAVYGGLGHLADRGAQAQALPAGGAIKPPQPSPPESTQQAVDAATVARQAAEAALAGGPPVAPPGGPGPGTAADLGTVMARPEPLTEIRLSDAQKALRAAKRAE